MTKGNNDEAEIWQRTSQHPQLDQEQVHLWRSNLELPTTVLEKLTTYLSPDELDKANKFRFPHHKRRYMAARGILRELLANYLQINPNSIQFEYGERGKPYITATSDNSLEFNLAHSEEYALYGFTYDYPIGVDLEHLRVMEDAAKIAQRFFTPREFQLVDCLEGEEQRKVFFQLWTAKEAYLKAIGTGLAGSLTSIDIGWNKSDPCLQAIQGSVEAVKRWSMYPCKPAKNYVGAIAIKAQLTPQQISYWHWYN